MFISKNHGFSFDSLINVALRPVSLISLAPGCVLGKHFPPIQLFCGSWSHGLGELVIRKSILLLDVYQPRHPPAPRGAECGEEERLELVWEREGPRHRAPSENYFHCGPRAAKTSQRTFSMQSATFSEDRMPSDRRTLPAAAPSFFLVLSSPLLLLSKSRLICLQSGREGESEDWRKRVKGEGTIQTESCTRTIEGHTSEVLHSDPRTGKPKC